MDRLQVPLFDEHFRGYGMNKITWSRNIAAQWHVFVVHPHAFMVHQPHPESCAKGIWRAGKPSSRSFPPKGILTQGKLYYSTCHCTVVVSALMQAKLQHSRLMAHLAVTDSDSSLSYSAVMMS